MVKFQIFLPDTLADDDDNFEYSKEMLQSDPVKIN